MDLVLPAEADSLAEAVALAIRNGISSRVLMPDTLYSVYQLAEVLGISRSPVREALLRLAEAGLVEIYRNRGFRIRTPLAHDVEEIFEIRSALEPPAAHKAALRATAADREYLADLLRRMENAARAGDLIDFWPADRDLHDALLRLSGNVRAAGIIDQLRTTTALLGPRSTATGRTLAEIVAEHRPIVDAVLAGDGPSASAAMRDHLDHTAALLILSLKS